MKKITLLLFVALTGMLNVANAQDITVFNFDGTTPTFSGGGDTFVSVANPVSDGVNSSANVGKFTHNYTYSDRIIDLTTAPIDPKLYTSFQFNVYSPVDGGLEIYLKNGNNVAVVSYSNTFAVTAGWTTITQNIVGSTPITNIAISFKNGTDPLGTQNYYIYLDDLKFIKNTDPNTFLYAENFSANINSWEGWTGAPTTKAGKWTGGIDLATAADANMNIYKDWNTVNSHALDMTAAAAMVTIPNINITGFNNIKLNFLNVSYAGNIAPVVEYKSGSGSWTPITVAVATGTWATQTITLPTLVDTDPLSLRFSSDATLGYRIDNLKVTGTAVSLGTESNQLSDNSIKVYPNPFVNEFKVDATDSEGPLQVSVFDILGRKVATAKSSSNQLSMGSSLKSGVYVVKVEGADAKDSKSFKIIKK